MVDYESMRDEYVTGYISQRELAEKHGVPLSCVARIAQKDNWVEERTAYREEKSAKLVQNCLEKTVEADTNRLLALQRAASRVGDMLEEMTDDSDQFRRYIVNYSRSGDMDAEERIYKKVDTRAMRDVVASIKDLTAAMRDLYGIVRPDAATALQNDGQITGVVMLPEREDVGDEQ